MNTGDLGFEFCETDYSLVHRIPAYILLDVVSDEHGYDKSIDGEDARHDDGDEGLHDEIWPHHRYGRNRASCFCRSIRCSQGYQQKVSGSTG